MEAGNNSVRDIWIIIPAIREKRMPKMVLFMYFAKNKYVIMAPNGSEIADTKV